MPRTTPPEAILSRGALNRALLARQLLLDRAALSPTDAIEHLVGLQAQAPKTPYVGLWTRLAAFRPDALSDLIATRQAVRIATMRATVHLVTARDCLTLRPVVQPVLDRGLQGNGRDLAGVDLAALVAAGRALVEEQPRTLAELRTLLGARWPAHDAASLAHAIHCLLPLIQVPPRGLWGASGQANCTTAEAWLGQPLAADTAPDDMLLRYLAAFGPASIQDMQKWSGLPALRAAVERLRPRLRTFRDERGRELFDLPDAPLPDPATSAPPRFLPEYDNALLSHADRTRIISEDHRKASLTSVNGIVPGTILLDGFVGGTWKLAQSRTAATLRIETFAPLSPPDRDTLAEEAERRLAFAAPDAPIRELQFAE